MLPTSPVVTQSNNSSECVVQQNSYYVLAETGTTYVLSNTTVAGQTVNMCCMTCMENTACDAWQWWVAGVAWATCCNRS